MYSYARAVFYAIVLWGISFLVTYLIYPLREDNPMLFATVRMLIMAFLSVFLTVMYFRDVEEHFLRDGWKLGALWAVASVLLDQGPFVWGLMRLSFVEYLMDTGIGYILYPIVTLGAAFMLSADKNMVEDSEAPGQLTKPYSPTLPGSKS